MKRDEEIAAYIAATAPLAWVWGETDCTSWLAGWIAARTGRDVGADLRRRGRSKRAVARLVNGAGGLVTLCAGLMREAGCELTRWPENGDVGVVRLPIGRRGRPVCALRAGGKWVIRTADGVLVVPVLAIAAWRVP